MGTDADMAQVLVRTASRWPCRWLPALVQNEGVTVQKQSPATLMIINLIGRRRQERSRLSEQLRDDLSQGRTGPRRGGRGINYLGQRDYSMRAWLVSGPAGRRFTSTPFDVVTAMPSRHPSGSRASRPAPVPGGQQFQPHINTKGRLSEAEEFSGHSSSRSARRRDKPLSTPTRP